MDLLTKELHEAFLHSTSYRIFLKKVFEIKKRHNPKFSYASFAMRAGISSKSHLREIILNKKRITQKTLPAIIMGFNLKGILKTGLEAMVYVEEKDLYKSSTFQKSPSIKLNECRNKISSILNNDSPRITNFSKKLSNSDWTVIYAALGDGHRGCNLEEIIQLTGLSKRSCLIGLKTLSELNMVSYNTNDKTYSAKELNLVLHDLGLSDFYKIFYIKSIERLKKHAEKDFSSQEKLYMMTHIKVSKKSLGSIKKDLSLLLTDYVSNIEKSDGDQIVTLVLGLS